METFHCECCDLEHANKVRQIMWEDYKPPTLCRECIEHRGKPQQRAEDHAREYRRRMEVAIGGAHDADNRASASKAEAHRAFTSRERVLAALDRIASYHQRGEAHGQCSCGKANCPTMKVLTDPWLVDRLVDHNLRDSGSTRGHFHTETDRSATRRRSSAG